MLPLPQAVTGQAEQDSHLDRIKQQIWGYNQKVSLKDFSVLGNSIMLKCPYCWIFPHWFVKCLYGIFLLPLFSTSIGIVKDRYLRMAENWRKISTRKTPNSKNLLSQCFSLWCVCTFVLLSSTYFPHTGAEVDVPPADLAGPWQENAPTSPPPWCSPTTAEDR